MRSPHFQESGAANAEAVSATTVVLAAVGLVGIQFSPQDVMAAATMPYVQVALWVIGFTALIWLAVRFVGYGIVGGIISTIATVSFVGGVVVLVVMLTGNALPWSPPAKPSAEQALLARVDKASAAAHKLGRSAVEFWTPKSAGTLDFDSVSVKVSGEPMIRIVKVHDGYNDGTWWQPVLKVKLASISNASSHAVSFDYECGSALPYDKREAARGSDQNKAAPAFPFLFVASPDGFQTASGYIQAGDGHKIYNSWLAHWGGGAGLGYMNLAQFEETTGEAIHDDKGNTIYVKDATGAYVATSFGEFALTAPLCPLTGDVESPSKLGITVPASTQDYSSFKDGDTVTFLLPITGATDDYLTLTKDDWTPLSQSAYPYVVGGLYLASDDYKTIGVVEF
ncbi:MAG: hypothetical protein LBR32_06845 [Propionibacteriaceae bacterium]|nr:hypothetical protein [Propionibacteriaceae bacterium]